MLFYQTNKYTEGTNWIKSQLAKTKRVPHLLILCVSSWLENSGFSQTPKICNIGIIANFVFPYICHLLPYLHQMILVNVKLDDSGYMSITFPGWRIHWSCLFLMAQLKQSCQYWHFCVAQSLWKTIVTEQQSSFTKSFRNPTRVPGRDHIHKGPIWFLHKFILAVNHFEKLHLILIQISSMWEVRWISPWQNIVKNWKQWMKALLSCCYLCYNWDFQWNQFHAQLLWRWDY